MKTITTALFVSAALMSGSVLAQSGSRLCGYEAPLAGSTIGNMVPMMAIVIEYGKKNKDRDTKKCKEIRNQIRDKISSNSEIKDLPWQEINRRECEDVGANYMDGKNYTSNDMCDNMDRDDAYIVKKVPEDMNNPRKGFVTTYEKM